MKRSPELRPNRWDGMMAGLIVILAVVCGVLIWGGHQTSGELSVVVSVDGEEVERCALAEFPDRQREYSANGYTLTVALAANDRPGIQVIHSDCPTQDCVHTGVITRAGQSIVCLPARIIIALEGDAAESGGPDLVIG